MDLFKGKVQPDVGVFSHTALAINASLILKKRHVRPPQCWASPDGRGEMQARGGSRQERSGLGLPSLP